MNAILIKTDSVEIDFIETRIKDLICVTKPYFALTNFQQLNDGILQAEVTVENLSSSESTLISGAEAGRHLAILGSCVLALENPLDSKHYYLANKAVLKRAKKVKENTHTANPQPIVLILQAKVVSLQLDQKFGSVEAKILTQNGDLIFTLNVSYQVLKADLFQKLFKRGYTEIPLTIQENPYTQISNFNDVQYQANILTADIGRICPTKCIGHFDNYPALPIAILCGSLAKLGAMHLKLMLNNDKIVYALREVTMSASRLAFAGEMVYIESNFICEKNGEYTFQVKALDENKKDLGEIVTTMYLL